MSEKGKNDEQAEELRNHERPGGQRAYHGRIVTGHERRNDLR
jgi:hypothetical protein